MGEMGYVGGMGEMGYLGNMGVVGAGLILHSSLFTLHFPQRLRLLVGIPSCSRYFATVRLAMG